MMYRLVVSVPGAHTGVVEVDDQSTGTLQTVESGFQVTGLGTFVNGQSYEITDEEAEGYTQFTGQNFEEAIGSIPGFELTKDGSQVRPRRQKKAAEGGEE
jgi:hypothetical protein